MSDNIYTWVTCIPIILQSDLQDGIIALGEKLLKQLKKGRRKNTIVDSSCTQPFQDKAFVLSSKSVRENDLPFTLIVQKPGDMVITFPRAYHQVTNAGFNFAVAVNFGYTSFLKDALLYEGCCWYVMWNWNFDDNFTYWLLFFLQQWVEWSSATNCGGIEEWCSTIAESSNRDFVCLL